MEFMDINFYNADMGFCSRMNKIFIRIQDFWDVMLCCWVKGS
jgi:hypothetical protein